MFQIGENKTTYIIDDKIIVILSKYHYFSYIKSFEL